MKFNLGINSGIRKFLLQFSGERFAVLANQYSRLKGNKPNFRYDSKNGLYSYSGETPDQIIYFRQKKRAFTYMFGYSERLQALGKSYNLDLIDFKEDDRIVDCGSNIGEIYHWFKLKQLSIDYTGFEPSPDEFSLLQRNAQEGRLNQVALWKEVTELDFYIDSDNADSSLIEPPKSNHSVKVKTDTLDNYLKEKIKLLKLEAEGAEPEILMGAGDSLKNIEYITAAVGPERGKNQEYTVVPVINILLKNHFEIVYFNTGSFSVLFRNTQFQKSDR